MTTIDHVIFVVDDLDAGIGVPQLLHELEPAEEALAVERRHPRA